METKVINTPKLALYFNHTLKKELYPKSVRGI